MKHFNEYVNTGSNFHPVKYSKVLGRESQTGFLSMTFKSTHHWDCADFHWAFVKLILVNTILLPCFLHSTNYFNSVFINFTAFLLP